MSLYRFSKRDYPEDFLKVKLSFTIASSYADVRLTVAQRDDKQPRAFNPDLKKHVFVINGSPIKALKEVKITHTARNADGDRLNYYLTPVLPDQASRAKLQEKQSAIFTKKYEDYINLGIEEWKNTSKELGPTGKKAILFIMTDDTKNGETGGAG